ncbi:ribose 1,5-bisphosphate isomerase [bacterium]|mgnify:CR=1 FL=1|nr:MAG: ribose 1,5-bisphosphate isomerase [bacterium]
MEKLNDIVISRAIVEKFMERLTDNLAVDVAIAGAGPAGIVAGYYLTRYGYKVAIFERKLSVGGGMWGGGIMFNFIVVQEDAASVLGEFAVEPQPYGEKGYYTACSVETMAKLTAKATENGVTIFNAMTVEDVAWDGSRVQGVVINWSAVDAAGLHVDPITVKATYVIDATGHDCDIVRTLVRKNKVKLFTPTGEIAGECSMFAIQAEKDVISNTREVYPGIYVAGMSANAVFGSQRMGPVFGGMILSGKRVANLIHQSLSDSVFATAGAE